MTFWSSSWRSFNPLKRHKSPSQKGHGLNHQEAKIFFPNIRVSPTWATLMIIWSFEDPTRQQDTTTQAIHYHPLGGSFTIANKSRKDRVVGPLPNGRTPWLINRGHILTTYPSILRWSSKHHPKDRGAKAIIKKSSTVKPGQDLGPLLKVELLVGYNLCHSLLNPGSMGFF